MSWSTYILECSDHTLYTGVTTDIARRVNEHNGEGPTAIKGAKYTRVRRPVTLLYSESFENRSQACKREAAIKKLSRQKKLQLIHADK
jgi:putative endonuclease